jgi:hypothetical protein
MTLQAVGTDEMIDEVPQKNNAAYSFGKKGIE